MSSALRNAARVNRMPYFEKRAYQRSLKFRLDNPRIFCHERHGLRSPDEDVSNFVNKQLKEGDRRNSVREQLVAKGFANFINDQLTEIADLKNCLSLKVQSAFNAIESFDFSEENCEKDFPPGIGDFLFTLSNNPLQAIKKYGNREDLEIWQNILSKITIIVDGFLKTMDESFKIADVSLIGRRMIWNNPKFNKFLLYIKARLLLNCDIHNILNTDSLNQEEIPFEHQKRIIDAFKAEISMTNMFNGIIGIKDIDELMSRSRTMRFGYESIGEPSFKYEPYEPEEEPSFLMRKIEKILDKFNAFFEKK